MAADTQVQAYKAFESQLKTLCLREFPCGLGTWVCWHFSCPPTCMSCKVLTHSVLRHFLLAGQIT